MFRAFNRVRAGRRSGIASAVALSLALATGAAVGIAGFAAPAMAQAKPKYSKDFVAVYEPLAEAFTAVPAGGDYAPIKSQVPAVVAAIANEDDRFIAGQLLVQIGSKANDRALQRQGAQLMLASGKVATEQLGAVHYFIGELALDAKDYAAARASFEAALAAGNLQQDPRGLIAETYFQERAASQGLAYLMQAIRDTRAAGQQVPENWYHRGLRVAMDNKLAAEGNQLAAMLVEAHPSENNWLAAFEVTREVNQFGNEEILDLSRLMSLTGTLKQVFYVTKYVEAADPRRLSNEVLAALDAAAAAGVIANDAPQFANFRRIAEERAETDRAEAPAARADAESSASGTAALGAGDLFLSIGSHADAEAMYQLAISKGGIDADRALTRLGIAQLRQGKAAEAQATFARVQGARAPLAKLWAVYAEGQGGASAGG